MKNVVIKQNCHSRMSLSGIPTLKNLSGGDPRLQASGMTSYLMSGSRLTYKEEALNKGSFRAPLRSGFTLIELLVVVLIIGILAAVAVPMYQRAVYKIRFSKLMLPAKTLASANEAFFLGNGEYATTVAALDVGRDTASLPDGSTVQLNDDEQLSYVQLSNNEVPNASYVVYQQKSANFAGNIHCEALDSDEKATWLCDKGLNGTKVETGEVTSVSGAGYSAYVLSGSTDGSTFDKTCEGDAPEVSQPCSSGCGVMTGTAVCNASTGEWQAQDPDPSSCPTQPEPEVASCPSGDGTKTRTASCNSDGTAYEWGQWDESACCTGTPPSTSLKKTFAGSCTGNNSGNEPVCVNGQWQWTSFSSNVVCQTNGAGTKQCQASSAGAENGGACTGTYTSYHNPAYAASGTVASCFGAGVYSCAKSTFEVLNGDQYSLAYCDAKADYACYGSSFIGYGSGKSAAYCTTSFSNGCSNSSFEKGAYCEGYKANACSGSTFKSNSYCLANVAGACDNVTYDGGYCTGSYCPAGSPKKGGGTW